MEHKQNALQRVGDGVAIQGRTDLFSPHLASIKALLRLYEGSIKEMEVQVKVTHDLYFSQPTPFCSATYIYIYIYIYITYMYMYMYVYVYIYIYIYMYIHTHTY